MMTICLMLIMLQKPYKFVFEVIMESYSKYLLVGFGTMDTSLSKVPMWRFLHHQRPTWTLVHAYLN